MDSFELNKILGALLGTCLVLLAVHLAAGTIFAATVPAKPGYVIVVKQEQPSTPNGTAAAPPAEQPIENLLASASTQQGAQTAKECELCHNLGKGQGAKVGPDLYGVVGRPVASEPGFGYSAALKAKGGTWTFDALNVWLTNPRADVPGTLMTFAGIAGEKQRANVIAYLNSNSDHPLPLPKAAQSAPGGAGGTSASTSTPPPKPPGTPSTVPPAGASPAPGTPASPGTQSPTPPAK
ncbi:MAG: cytochrome c family protein [Xanthobacteraceae bacterium]